MMDSSLQGDKLEPEVGVLPPSSVPSSTATYKDIGSMEMLDTQNVQTAQVGNYNNVTNVFYGSNDRRDRENTREAQHEDLHDLVTARADHEIYCSQLLTKKRGYPLWVPGPGRQLPIEYRREGITIGDVGIITSLGAFNFLFNIFRPANHPINRGGVPRNFSPLSLAELMFDIQEDIVYGPGTHLASSSVQTISMNLINESSVVRRFESTAREAAILVMPDGATTKDLFSTQTVCDTISNNAEDWYKYAKDTRGRQNVKNGDIRVVVGIDKVSSWGVATSASTTEQTASYVFKHDPIHAYKWDCTGGSGRVGPQKKEICDLLEDNTLLENQCVFARTINFTLSGEMWKNFPSEAAVEVGPRSGSFDYQDSASSNRGTPRQDNGSSGINTSLGHHPGSTKGSLNCTPSVNFDRMELGVNHPSAALHNCLHEKFPDARLVITEDMDWISVLETDEGVFPSAEDLSKRMLETHEPQNNSGIICLLRKDDTKLRQRSPNNAPLIASEKLRAQESLFHRSGSPTASNSKAPWHPLPSPIHPPYETDMHSRDNSTSSSSSYHLDPDYYQGGTHDYDQDCQLSVEGASEISTKSALTTSLWSRSLLHGRSREKVPKLDLQIPSHSLSMGTLLGTPSQSSRNATFASQSVQGMSWKRPGTSSSFYDNTLQHLHPSPGNQTASTSLNRDSEILQLMAEASHPTQIDSSSGDSLRQLSQVEQAIQSRRRTLHVNGGVVTSGTLEGLVQFLIAGFGLQGNSHYRDTFLTACSELTTPDHLFQILSRRLLEEQHTTGEGNRTQYTIFMFILYWLQSNCFSPSVELLCRMKIVCKDAIRAHAALESIAKRICQLIDVKMTALPTAPRVSNPDAPILKPSQITPRDLAVALGLLEGDNYKALQPSDYLQHLSRGQSNKLKTYNITNEKIRLWVIRSILHYDTVPDRSQLMKFYIKTAIECLSMRNFSSTVAISRALHSSLIEKLKATRRSLSEEKQAKLSTIYEITHPESNHRGYYTAIQSPATLRERKICIPWLDVHLKELDKVIRQPATVLVHNQHLVDFTRQNRFMERIKETLFYSPPDLEYKRHGGQLTYLLYQLGDIDVAGSLEEKLFAKSDQLGIQESKHSMSLERLRRVGFI